MEEPVLIQPLKNSRTPLVSIILSAFNHAEYTRLCVESLYRFTTSIDFELITVNNGSNDDTEQIFNSLPHQKKLTFAYHAGTSVAVNAALKFVEGKYTVFLRNDLILTPNWLNNLLKCIESDEKIAIVVPACNISDNNQQVSLQYNNMDEMIQSAAAYNNSTPTKWEERLQLTTYACLTKTDIMKNFVGLEEAYTPGDFTADFCFRLRRAGYKLIFAKDTFLHRLIPNASSSDGEKFDLLERNRRIFSSKFDVDAWNDCLIDWEIVNLVECGPSHPVDVLTLCVSCGGTALQVKNKLRENGFPAIRLWTLTEEQKYLADLNTISDYTLCDRFENITDIYKNKRFDYILSEVDLQSVVNPHQLLEAAVQLLQPEGQFIFAAANESFYLNVINLLNGNVDCDSKFSRCGFNIEKLQDFLVDKGFDNIQLYYSPTVVPPEHHDLLENLKKVSMVENKQLLDRVYAARRILFSAKNKNRIKSVLLYPGYDIWLNDIVFNKNIGNMLGIELGENFYSVLRQELAKHHFNLRTIDKGNIEESTCIIYIDLPKSYNSPLARSIFHYLYQGEHFFKQWLSGSRRSKLVLFLWEPPFVTPENYDRNLHQSADVIFTYLDDLVDNTKYFKFILPAAVYVENPYATSYGDKQLCTLIAGNKFSNVPGELYSERRSAIEYFENQPGNPFDLYGRGWKTSGYQCYKGEIAGKLAVLSRYRYCICYENGAINGYITEKIFDCFVAGCVPIYLGAPDITKYIPANTFIDRRTFGSYEEMHRYISGIGESEYNTYLDNIDQFLHSESFQKFTFAGFAQTVARVLVEQCK
ncbi:MAG: glycosyltransferase [Veillonellales bacterium]